MFRTHYNFNGPEICDLGENPLVTKSGLSMSVGQVISRLQTGVSIGLESHYGTYTGDDQIIEFEDEFDKMDRAITLAENVKEESLKNQNPAVAPVTSSPETNQGDEKDGA